MSGSKKDKPLFYIKGEIDKEEEYISVVENYINYYEKRAKKCKYEYFGFSIIKYIFLFLAPLAQIVKQFSNIDWIPLVCSSGCLLIELLLDLWRAKEKWILYRNTYNILISELRRYKTSSGIYSEEQDGFRKFVENVESIIGDEAQKWQNTVRVKEDKKEEA